MAAEQVEECCVCLQSLPQGQTVTNVAKFSGCQHKTHADCLVNLLHHGHVNCPICRNPMFKFIRQSETTLPQTMNSGATSNNAPPISVQNPLPQPEIVVLSQQEIRQHRREARAQSIEQARGCKLCCWHTYFVFCFPGNPWCLRIWMSLAFSIFWAGFAYGMVRAFESNLPGQACAAILIPVGLILIGFLLRFFEVFSCIREECGRPISQQNARRMAGV